MDTRRTVLKTAGVGAIAAVGFSTSAIARGKAGSDLFAPLTSGETVPNVRSWGTGTATFTEDANGDLTYEVTLQNIEDVTQAHVHVAPRGQTGGIVAFLLDFAPLTGSGGTPQSGTPHDPIVESGTITDTALVANILDSPGDYYVNVHTRENARENAPGEIRGQIRAK